MNRRIEQSAKLIPLGGIFIILCSSVKHVIYYSYFNIPITDYLGLQEYATLFIDDILLYTMMFGIAIILNYSSSDEKIEARFEDLKNNQKDFKKPRIIAMLLLVLSIISILLIMFFVEDLVTKLRNIKVLIWVALSLLYVFLLFSGKRIHYIFIIMIAILVYTIFDANISANQITNFNKLHSYTIEKNSGEILQTDEQLNYIGKSEKFLFIYDQTNKSSLILKMENICSIKITERNSS